MPDSDSLITLTDKNCIAIENSNCEICELEGKLLCKVDKKFATRFLMSNISYRVIAIALLTISGFIIGHWWMVGSYIVMVLLTFLVLEPRLLCSHCPFYEKEGKVLKCWALQGMPKLWKYRPEPISKIEKYLMLIIGAFIDLFPLISVIWVIVWFARNPSDKLILSIIFFVISFVFILLMVLFGEVILKKGCKRCANFSCGMNKVPEEIVKQFLERNRKMKGAWEKSGK